MKHKPLHTILLIAGFLLLAELIVTAVLLLGSRNLQASASPRQEDATAAAPAEEPAEAAAEEPAEEPQVATPAPAVSGYLIYREREEEHFLLSFTGDCTLATDAMSYGGAGTFVAVVGDDYAYPFSGMRDIFAEDDFTIVNLECALTERTATNGTIFAFRGPAAYTNILTEGNVDFVSFANNHTFDYGQDGYDDSLAALDASGLPYVTRNSTAMYETESGLKIGVYAAFFTIDEADMAADIAALREAGAELVIASLHWGDEGTYHPTADQEYYGHAAIDAGADIVYGHHPHVLQRIEQYGSGVIYYSLGNFSFGGNTNPRDRDTAVLQQEVIRGTDGSIRLGALTIIPCCVSSTEGVNDFRPTPYAEGSEEYARTLTKLDGTFDGPDLTVNYYN